MDIEGYRYSEASVDFEVVADLSITMMPIFYYLISNRIDAIHLQCYTSQSSFHKYGKIKIDIEGLKIFVLSSVIPVEQEPKMFNVDKILRNICDRIMNGSLVFEIDGLENKLSFSLVTGYKAILPFIQKIIFGEIRLKGKYCSEIFTYIDSGFEEDTDLIMFDEICDKLYVLPLSSNYDGGWRIGSYMNDTVFLKQLFYSELPYKINDVYIQLSPSRYEDELYNDVENLAIVDSKLKTFRVQKKKFRPIKIEDYKFFPLEF